MKTNPCTVSALTLFVWLALPCAAQTIYNPATDFSAASNPTGVWSYGYANTGTIASLSNTFSLFTSSGTWNGRAGLDRWNRPLSYPNDYPLIFKNTTGSAIDYGGGLVIAAGQFGMIGGPEGIVANTRLTLPATGQYSLSATFTRLQSPASSVDVWIVIGGTVAPINQTLYDVGASASVANYLFYATASTTVDFIVGPNAGGAAAMSNDTTSLVATVTAIPEPATWAALAGLAAGLAVAWRRRALGPSLVGACVIGQTEVQPALCAQSHDHADSIHSRFFPTA